MITFHEEGCVWEVEVCDGPYPDPKLGGDTFDLKVLAVRDQNPSLVEPKVGEAFSVWRAEGAMGQAYCGWSLRHGDKSL